ncbi:MAG: hypothetical protein ACRDT4_21480 [Micromonosporaceae bacterium]
MSSTVSTLEAPPRRAVGAGSGWALGVAGALVLVSWLVGLWLTRTGVDLHLGTTWPLRGQWRPAGSVGLVAAAVVAGLAVWHAPLLAVRLSWRRLLGAGYTAGVAWPVSLALSDGLAGLTRPLSNRWEYPYDVPRVGPDFLATFNDHVLDSPQWTTHVGGHPPGALGVFVLLDRVGLGGALPAALLCIAVGAAAVPAVLSTVRLYAGEEFARRTAPYLVFAPAALWIATSADALFAGVGALGVCALAHAATRHDRKGDLLAAAGGLALGGCLFLSYGLLLLGPLAVGVVAVRRRIRPLLVGGAVVLALLVAAALAGFHWYEGLQLATERVRSGPAWQDRPGWYFWIANPAAVAIAVGPAVVAALPAGLRRRTPGMVLWVCALGAIAVATASGLSKGEVERIYLPFLVWLLLLAGLLPERHTRRWLAAQVGLAIALEALLWFWW